MLQEAASGEQMAKLQKELEQLRTNTGQMKVSVQAAQQSQRDAQVPPSCLDTVPMLGTRGGCCTISCPFYCWQCVISSTLFCLFLSLLHLIFGLLMCIDCLLPELVLVIQRSGPSQQH